MHKQNGFTLVELMIVVAIIGILVAVAYPSYHIHVQKTKRSDGQIGLLEMADRQERYYLQNNTYAPTTSALYGSAASQYSPEDKYQLTVTSGDANGFVLNAAAQAEQVSDTLCVNMILTQAGGRTPVACWD
jgi:type IV pilus assembly protein PilE